jgi:hypothetical protein
MQDSPVISQRLGPMIGKDLVISNTPPACISHSTLHSGAFDSPDYWSGLELFMVIVTSF